MIRYLCTLLLFLLSACSHHNTNESYRFYYAKKNLALPSNNTFVHCRNYGCQTKQTIELSIKQQKEIKALFTPAPDTAKKEREQIALAIGLIERITGDITGSAKDKGGTFKTMGTGQLDCIDESTNTTSALLLLSNNNLLQFHTIVPPTTRLPILGGGPWAHQTAVIQESATQAKYAVDSWFKDNGYPADIVLLSLWKTGWSPNSK